METPSKNRSRTHYRSVGTTYDGVRILAPKTKPTHFTTREIRRTIEKVLRERQPERPTLSDAESSGGKQPRSANR